MSGAEDARHEQGPDRAGPVHRDRSSGTALGFELGGVRLEVDGRAAHDCDDTWDANWLSVTATCAAAGAEVVVPGAVVSSWSVERFCGGLDSLVRTGVGSAYLTAESPNLMVRVESLIPDAPITVRAELTADSNGQGHWFAFAVTRAELRTTIARCQEILEAHPAKQVAG